MERFRPTPLTNMAASAPVVARMPTFGGRVEHVLPGPFPAYARILHRPDQGMPYDDEAATWAAVAAARGTVLHEAAQMTDLAGWRSESSGVGGDETVDPHPLEGTLDRGTLGLLVDVLGAHTADPGRCLLALWVGFGSNPREWSDAATFRTPGREYWLFESTLDAVAHHASAFATARLSDDDPRLAYELALPNGVQSPQLWWPDDLSWAVASEIDYDSTLVGGEVALVEDLLAAPGIECLRMTRGTSLCYDADLVNRKGRTWAD